MSTRDDGFWKGEIGGLLWRESHNEINSYTRERVARRVSSAEEFDAVRDQASGGSFGMIVTVPISLSVFRHSILPEHLEL